MSQRNIALSNFMEKVDNATHDETVKAIVQGAFILGWNAHEDLTIGMDTLDIIIKSYD